jgi:HEAT repeat protein
MRRIHTALGLLIACAGLMSVVVGCTTLRLTGMADGLALVAATSPAPSPALLEAIRTSLSIEAWRFNRAWTAEAEWAARAQRFPAPSTLRWSFGKSAETTEKPPFEELRSATSANRKNNVKTPKGGQPSKPEPASKNETAEAHDGAAQSDPAADAKSSEKSAEDNSIAWDGFWPLTVSDLVHRNERSEGRGAEAAAATVNEGMRCLHRLARVNSLAGWNAAILWAEHDPQSAVEIVDVLERLVTNPPIYVVETGEPDSDKLEGKASSSASKTSSTNEAQHKPGENPPPVPRRPTRRIAPSTQAAAAEAWCLVLAASAGQAVDGLAPAGRALERVNLLNSVRGELFRGVAAWVPPVRVPRLENALRQGAKKTRAPADIRQAAMEACLIYAINRERSVQPGSPGGAGTRSAAASKRAPSEWPSTVMTCRIDPDFQVRRTFIQWLGRARPDGAFELLKTQAESAEVGLRLAALESLGRLHTDAAHAEIKSQAEKSRDTLRAAAVGALTGWGLQEIAHYAHDKSQVVRIAVARELGKQPTLDSAVLLTAMVVDPSLDVQLAAIEAVKTWPNDVAFPLLLHAMRDSSAKTRFAAFGQVSQRQKVDVDYRFDGPPDQRQAAVNAVAASVGSSLSYLDQMLRREPRAVSQVNALRAAEIREHLAALIENPSDSAAASAAREWLAGIGPKDLPVVEAFLKEPTKTTPEAIYRDVLPRISPVYAALLDLESSDLTIRRRGARTLADRGQAVSLSRPVLSRLQERLYRETDELVWRWAITAIGSDSTEDCAEIANLALHHQSAEVRQLGCEYLARHGQPAYAVWLLDLLDDRDRSVKLAAIRALGNCGNQVAVRGLKPDKAHNASPNLRSLLSSSDGGVRFAAAVSLCRLGTPEGMQELVRLSYHSNPDTREQAVKEMGLSGQTRFVSQLVTLGWTERNSQVRQAILDSLDRLVPEENRPRPLGETLAPDAKMKCWVEWLQQRGSEGGATTASPARSPALAPAPAKGPTPGGPVVTRPDEG